MEATNAGTMPKSDGINKRIGKHSLYNCYLHAYIKRFGDFVLNLDAQPQDIERIKNLSIFHFIPKKQKTPVTN